MQLSGAVFAEPDYYPGSVYPIKGGNLLGHLHCLVALQSLERLDEEHSVVEVSIRGFIAMHTFAFIKKLLLHKA